jgi:hypothetical protein
LAAYEQVRLVLELDNRSGHYLPGPESLVIAQAAFVALGFEVPGKAIRSYNEVAQ